MKLLKKSLCLMLALLLVLSLTACKSKTEKYQESLTTIINEISDMNSDITTTVTALQTALGAGDKTSYDAALVSLKTYSDSLKSKYQAIAAVEAPKDLEDKRLALKGHADNLCTMLDDSIELYTIAGEALSKDLTEEQISRMNILQTEIGQLQGSADSFDSILNEIMAAE